MRTKKIKKDLYKDLYVDPILIKEGVVKDKKEFAEMMVDVYTQVLNDPKARQLLGIKKGKYPKATRSAKVSEPAAKKLKRKK